MTNKELNAISEPKEEYKKKKKDKESEGNALALELLARYDLISMGDQFYQFTDNYYKPMSEIDLEGLIHKELGENIEPKMWDCIIRFLRVKTQIKAEDVDKNWDQIACKNGILNVVAGVLTLPTKNDFNTIYIPWRWNDNPLPSDIIISFMASLANGDANKVQFLYEVVGYCLLKRNLYRKFFIFQGPGGTGKSTFQRLIEKLVGSQNVSHVGLNNFDNDYFLAKLPNKLVNLDDDAVDGKALDDSGRFKSITAGECITARPIREAPREFIPFCTCLFNCNRLPRIMDTTTGLYSRIIIVELNHVIDKPIPKFEEILTEKDMEYFLFKAVRAIGEVIERKGFTINSTSESLLQRFKCRQSGINEWLLDSSIKIKDLHLKRCQVLHSQFMAWAAIANYKHSQTINTFKEEVAAAMGVTVELLEDENKNTYFGFFCKEVFTPKEGDEEQMRTLEKILNRRAF
jgi:P4 family phage/plasmid primase-like protien